MADVRGGIRDQLQAPRRELVAQARGTDAGTAGAGSSAGGTGAASQGPTPVPVDIDIHTWSGKYGTKRGSLGSRAGQFAYNAVDALHWATADYDVTSIDELVQAVHDEMAEARRNAEPGTVPYVRELVVVGHGAPANVSHVIKLNLVTKSKTRLATLKPYFRKDSRVQFQSCEVAQGYQGEWLLQRLADIWNVETSSTTGPQNVYGMNAGFEITRKPGQKLEPWSEVTARQVVGELREANVVMEVVGGLYGVRHTKFGRILAHLEAAKRRQLLKDVRQKVEKEGVFDDLVELLSDDEVLEEPGLSVRVRALGITEVNAALSRKRAAAQPQPAPPQGGQGPRQAPARADAGANDAGP